MRKIFISTKGDPSVGIQGDNIIVDMGYDITNVYDESREDTRKKFQEFFENYTDGKPRVEFDDECGECGSIITDKCPNQNCIQNIPDNDWYEDVQTSSR